MGLVRLSRTTIALCVVTLAALAVIGLGIVNRNATEIAVTSRRVLIKTGVVNRRTVELLVAKIESAAADVLTDGRKLPMWRPVAS